MCSAPTCSRKEKSKKLKLQFTYAHIAAVQGTDQQIKDPEVDEENMGNWWSTGVKCSAHERAGFNLPTANR